LEVRVVPIAQLPKSMLFVTLYLLCENSVAV
jgi:hypothetical protein